MILSNQVECLKCGDKPFSTNRHDFKYCKCGNIAVDGGMDYLRRVGKLDEYKDISIEIPDEHIYKLSEVVKWANDTNRNEFGMVCAIMRTLRDLGYDLQANTD